MTLKSQNLTLVIDEETANQRIDKALATVTEIGSRSQALRLLQQGCVRKNGKVVKPSYLTALGDQFDLVVPIQKTEHLIPLDLPLDIVYEDSELLVVNKPAGLVVHPACGHEQDTLVNALLHHTTELSLGYNENRPGLVHRIDKGTSGLLVIAKNDHAQRTLALQFQKKTTHRVYWAIAHGHFAQSHGTIKSYLRRHPENRKRMASLPVVSPAELAKLPPDWEPEGKLAITHYKVLAEHQVRGSAPLSLVQLQLETGRTHQIRVHLTDLGHPILGDTVYGGERRLKTTSEAIQECITSANRFALHAAELGFRHPTNHRDLKFRAPCPKDLEGVIAVLGWNGLVA